MGWLVRLCTEVLPSSCQLALNRLRQRQQPTQVALSLACSQNAKRTSFDSEHRVFWKMVPWRKCHFQVTNQGNIGALIIRTGFGVYYAIIVIRNPPKPYSPALLRFRNPFLRASFQLLPKPQRLNLGPINYQCFSSSGLGFRV